MVIVNGIFAFICLVFMAMITIGLIMFSIYIGFSFAQSSLAIRLDSFVNSIWSSIDRRVFGDKSSKENSISE